MIEENNTGQKKKFSVVVDEKKNSSFDAFVDWQKEKKVPQPTQTDTRKTSLPYVKWGKTNDYPYFLNTLYAKSPTQTGIINGKVYHITSGGFTIDLNNPNDVNEKQKVDEFIRNGSSEFTREEVIFETVKDAELYNGFYLHGVWNLQKTAPKFLEWIGFDEVRTNKTRTRFFISQDWSKSYQSFEETGFKEIPLINLNERVGEFIVGFIKVGKKTEPSELNVYPLPPYSGCIEALMTEIEHNNFNLYEVLNSYKSGTILTLPNPQVETEDEKDEIADDIKAGSTNRETAGGLTVLFTEGNGNDEPKVLNLSGNDLPDRYINVDKSTKETIIVGHSIPTPAIFGIKTEGQLGAQTEMEAAFEIFKNTYVQARQRWISDCWNWVLKNLYGIQGTFKMNPPKPLFSIATQATPQQQNTFRKQENECFHDEKYAEEFLARDPVLKAFENYGRKRSGFTVVKSFEVPIECSSEWFEQSEKEIFESLKHQKHYFATTLSETEKNVLKLIDEGNDPVSISKGLKISVQDVMNTYNALSSKGLVKKSGELSESGKRYLNANETSVDQYEIRYSYELRPGVKGPEVLPTTRNFCRELVAMDKLYTREDINQISASVDRDVWKYKGGWWRPKGEETAKPFCRHYWKQNLVLKRK